MSDVWLSPSSQNTVVPDVDAPDFQNEKHVKKVSAELSSEAVGNPEWLEAGSGGQSPALAKDRTAKVLSQGKTYFPALDGLRGIAILLVIVYHCSELLDLGNSSNEFDWFAWSAFQLGWVGVDLFFVLSGFLITGILLDAKSEPNYFRTFYARRSLRIFPLYYLIVLFTFILFPPISDFIGSQSVSAAAQLDALPSTQGKEWWYLLYASNFLAAIEGNMGHRMLAVTWSLAIEEQFYFIWPLVIYLFRTKTVMAISCWAVVIAFICRCGLVVAMREGYLDLNRTAIYVWPFCRMDALSIGAIVAILWRRPEALPALKLWSKRCLIFGTPLFFVAILAGKLGSRDAVHQTFGYSFLAFFFGALLIQTLLLQKGTVPFGMITHPVILQFGKFAYAIYLFHVPLMFGLDAMWFGKILEMKVLGSAIPSLAAFILLLSVLVYIAAKISWITIERPFLKLKRYFPSSSDAVSQQRET